MKTLVIADRNPKINIPDIVAQNKIDLVITLGDLTREDILGLTLVNKIPKIGVYGNHDSGSYMEEFLLMK
jgi:predicted phosphodiesterase